MSELKGGPLVWAIRDARGIPGNVKHLLHVVASRGESGCTSRWDVVAGDMGVGKSAFYGARTAALELGLIRAHRRWDDTTVYLVDTDVLRTYLDHSGNREITPEDHSGNRERQSANQDEHSGNQDGQSANQETKKNLQNLQNLQNRRTGDEDEQWRLLVESFNCTDVPSGEGEMLWELITDDDHMVRIEPYVGSRVTPSPVGEVAGDVAHSASPVWQQPRRPLANRHVDAIAEDDVKIVRGFRGREMRVSTGDSK